jgi:hypothetical protein
MATAARKMTREQLEAIAARAAADDAFAAARTRLGRARLLERTAEEASRRALVNLGKARAETMDAEQQLRRAFAERAQLEPETAAV